MRDEKETSSGQDQPDPTKTGPIGNPEKTEQISLKPDGTAKEAHETPTVPDGEDQTAEFSGSIGLPVKNDRVPDYIGAYRIEAELGRGGMGTVYVAIDPKLGRRVALKLLPREVPDSDAFDRFREEARLLAAISHPNIATIFSLEEAEEQQFLTMEIVPGSTLGERLRTGPFPVGEWFVVARQVCVALVAAHDGGIAHLDLKPGNVMLTDEGLVKVLDFGLAMALGTRNEADGESNGGGARTKARAQESISGTPGYMAPEQIQGRPVDSRADVWALGCVLYESATGQKAFSGESMTERLRASLTREPDMTRFPEEFPTRIVPVLRKALAKDVSRRTATVDELLEELETSLHSSAPALKETPHNLPSNPSSFVGRMRQKSELLERLGEGRLHTLTGVGGGGKSRLALEIARESLETFHDGVWLVELAPLTDPAQLPSRLLRVLGGQEEPGKDLVSTIVSRLAEKKTLIVLDDCETHLVAVASLAHELLRSCGDLSILSTSREALGIQGESIHHLGSLAVPEGDTPASMDEFRRIEAVELFETRARAVRPDFEIGTENAAAVHQICQRLDGIPLAIELAAARVRVLAPSAIAERLDDRFRLLTSSKRGAVPHHQTLRALIDWSYDHLEPGEQATLDRLSIFAGGWELEASEKICIGDDVEDWEILDHLSNLVDKSLVEFDTTASEETGRTRYRLLQTIRAYARERLQSRGEEKDLGERHRRHFLELAETGVAELARGDQAVWLRLLAADHHNFRVALEPIETDTDLETRLVLAGTLGRYWAIRGHWSEGRSTLDKLLEGVTPRTSATALALNWAGNFAKLQGDVSAAHSYLEQSLEIRREIADEPGIASSLHNLGNVTKDSGDRVRAKELYLESRAIYERLGDEPGMATTANALGMIAAMEGDLDGAGRWFSESLSLREKLKDRHESASCLNNLGWVAEVLGNLEEAKERQQSALEIHRELGQKLGVAASLTNLANLAKKLEDLPGAQASYEEALALVRELGDRRGEATILNNLGDLDLLLEDLDRSEERYRRGLEILADLGDRATLPHLLRALGQVAAGRGDARRAATLLGAAEGLRNTAGTKWSPEAEVENRERENELRKVLGDTVDEAMAVGRTFTSEDAILFALGRGHD